MRFVIYFVLCVLLPLSALAVQKSRPLPGDPRFHVITYNPNGIHLYTGYYGYQASILLEDGELVQTMSMGGDPSAWQIVPATNRIFIKPISTDPEDAKTNMLLITNRRVYQFILQAEETGPKGIDDPNLVFQTQFVYPDGVGDDIVTTYSTASQDLPDLSEPGRYNFNYTISGDNEFSPIRVFDDGEFTYFQFSKKNADLPAFFMVDSTGRDALINYRAVEDYIIIERVTSQFTLRHGFNVVCVFNESRPMRDDRKKKWSW